jgi:acyl transferase domain-containing protein/NADPH:quinone reductase-like Zn-dependent oxidoreductase/acyl carrier protein
MTVPADKVLEALRASLQESERLRQRNRQLASASRAPVAIVGMSCRLPGDVRDPHGLWELLAGRVDAISEFPADRGWDIEGLYGADPGGASPTLEGGFVYEAPDFDAQFFGISPREALAMDPQQRMLLETSWEALERAGIDPGSLRGSATGVFTGATSSGYQLSLNEGATGSEGYMMTGGLTAVISGRVAYVLGLEGPAVTVDTACSSSLVALHLACQALRSGECALALAGGVSVLVTPGAFADFSQQQGLAANGRCKSFSASADGTGWSEGAGVVVLERLADARRNGHRVLAVVRGSAVNSDGASNGLTAPSGPSQQRVIRTALASARLTADQVDAVEAHGTGTVLGDPIEAEALLATYGQNRPEDRPLWLGSVKSNIGHSGATAGVAGVIKMVLALQHAELPPTLHADEPSPHVDWSAGNVRLLTEPVRWLPNGRPRRAGVSSFGISGTNAHAILEEAPTADAGPPAPDDGDLPVNATAEEPAVLDHGVAWVVSGRSAEGLVAQAGRLGEFVAARPELDPGDVGWSLATTRSVFEHRAVVAGTGRDELIGGLRAVAAGEPAAGVVTGSVPSGGGPGRVVFVFPGQGGQWAGMGRELAAASPVFASRLAECGRALARFVDWSLDEVLADARALQRVDVVQPALWAVMVSLAAVWEAAGVTPDAVVGHSQGEIAAACVAGIVSLEDAAKVVALRSRALTALAGRGGMVSVAEPADSVRKRLPTWGERLAVAAVNGPAATVVSGEPGALEELAAACEATGVRARVLPVDYASHSAQVVEIRDEILHELDGIAPGPARIPMMSASSGEWMAGQELDAGYWYTSLRSPVEFDRAIQVLANSGHRVFVEVSAHPVLTAAITATVEQAGQQEPVVAGTLRRDDGSPARLLVSMAEVFVGGVAVDWRALLGRGQPTELPTYAFQRQRYWPVPGRAQSDVASAGLDAMSHPLLGAAVDLHDDQGLVLTGRLSVREQPWLADHAVAGMILLPGTAFVEMAAVAGHRAGCPQVEELTLEAPLVVPDSGAVQVQVMVDGPDESRRRAVEVFARPRDAEAGPWTRHASGVLAPVGRPAGELADVFTVWPPEGAVPVEVAGLYAGLAEGGYGYGPAFQGLKKAWRRDAEVFAEVVLPEVATGDVREFGVHPALLDAVLHTIGLAAATGNGDTHGGSMGLPFSWRGVSVHATGASALRARVRRDGGGGWELAAADPVGAPVVSVASLALRPVTADQLTAARDGLRDALFGVEWVPVPVTAAVAAGQWAVVGRDWLGIEEQLASARIQTRRYPDLAELVAALTSDGTVPEVVLACAGSLDAGAVGTDQAVGARLVSGQVLGLLQEWLVLDGLGDSRLVVVTQGAVAAVPGEGVADLAAAAAWGLVRSAQSENPGRLVLADLPPQAGPADFAALAGALGSGEPELAIRDGAAHARRLARPAGGLTPPNDGGPWRLEAAGRGTLDGLALARCPQAAGPLGAGQVRVAVRAAGVNFRDVLIGLDMYPGEPLLGSEVAGVVAETGPGVSGLAAGDRVLGIAGGGFGPVAVTDARLLAPMPDGWSFAKAAAVPVAFATAWLGLVDLAAAAADQRVLVHAATGGVGMAAVAIARHLGLEVFATASPGKHGVLRDMGFDGDHIASSRSGEFEERFRAATDGAGMDLVLNCLAGELTDASLRLLPRGGTFLEMGKTDIRDASGVAAEYPGVAYRAFDLGEAGPDRLGEILAQVTGLLASGRMAGSPVRAWDVRQALTVLRFMSQARHTGKLVLTMPPDPAAPRVPGTVLVTGGTGMLGSLVARHLADVGQARHMVLVSRSGPAAAGAARLAAGLAASGFGVQVTVCDAADRDALKHVLAGIPRCCPLTGVVHTAGVLDDGLIGSLTPGRVAGVMRPKADAAWNLHELTQAADLDLFVLFSSAAATFGGAGQGSYAAANAFMDALAARRRAAGLPATSVAWALWAGASGMTAHLSAQERARASGGMAELSAGRGLELLDAAVEREEALLVAAPLDVAGLRSWAAQGGDVPAVLRGLAGGRTRPSAAAGGGGADGLRQELSGLGMADRGRVLLDLVRVHVAAVLGHASPEAIDPDRSFSDIGFDSLTAVELRNRLNAATGLRLPATLVFDYPTPVALAGHLQTTLAGDVVTPPAQIPVQRAADDEPVAIVGMACRFPGGVRDPEGLWELVAGAGDGIGMIPADRGWDIEDLYDPDPDRAGTSYVREGGFIHDAADFDPAFFGINPREALAMDPQQRLLLETSWEALERVGVPPTALRGTRTGVFAGGYSSGYSADSDDENDGTEGYLLTGTATSVISGRVAYALGLEGPAVTVDTACSSSLVALHMACQALRSGECDLALAGGVTIMTTPGGLIGFSRQRGLAADGRCKAFSAAADGMGLGEGAGMLVVERLSDARRRGHRVLAVVRGSAVNQDGASNGLTVPNGLSQQRVIRAALASAGLAPGQVDAVEAHGTGTTLGDPIEAQALLATYGQDRDPQRPLWLGSVKSNIGHTQAAAGVAGVIKMVLALGHRVLPPTLHAGEPSPHVDWSSGAVSLLTGPVPWDAGGRPRRAGVSAFGMSGTNAHVILEEAPAADGGQAADPGPAAPVLEPGVAAWPVSGRTAAALREQASRLARFTARQEPDPADVAWSLAGRSVFEHRAVVIGASRDELAAGLAAVASDPAAAVTGSVPAGGPGRVAFAFPGQGAQWAGMGCELAERSPVFAARLAECGQALAPYVDWSLPDVIAGAGGAPGLDRAHVAQPALWAVMVSLAAVWEAAGVAPDAVVGHSQGEIAAACVAGILTLQDAARVVAMRSAALSALNARGAMVSVVMPAAAVRELLASWGGRLSVAAVNGPAAVVVSGDLQALEELEAELSARHVLRWRLPQADFVAHSPRVEELKDGLLAGLAPVRPAAGRVRLFSTAECRWMDGTELDAAYWYANVRNTVRYDEAVRALAAAGHRVFIEVSPHPVLTTATGESLEETGVTGAVVTGTLDREDAGPARMLTALARVHVAGTTVNWAAVLGHGQRVDLPTYAFQRQRYWPVPGRTRADVRSAGLDAVTHPLLGAAVELAGGQELLFTGRISARDQPWLADHVLAGTALLPGTAFLELAMVAGYRAGCERVEELTLEAPLVFPGEGAVQVQVTVGGPDEGGRRTVEVYFRPEGQEGSVPSPWTRHATGQLAPGGESAGATGSGDLATWPPPGATRIETGGLYDSLAVDGYEYGPAFRGVRSIWRRGEEIFAEVTLPEGADRTGKFGMHPALLDAVLHVALAAGPAAGRPTTQPDGLRMPAAWHGVSLTAADASVLRARLTPDSADGWSLTAADALGEPVLSVELLKFGPSHLEPAAGAHQAQDALFGVEWVPVPALDAIPEGTRAAVLGDDHYSLAARLTSAGADVARFPDLHGLAAAVEAGESVPKAVFVCAGSAEINAGDGEETAAAAQLLTGRILCLIQEFLAAAPLERSRLVVVTRRAMPAGPGERVADLAAAAVWGLTRSAQSENPGRLVLADLPEHCQAEDARTLAGALADEEPELLVRDSTAYGRRLTRLTVPRGPAAPRTSGTVLVTGGTGTLGALTARHLAGSGRARQAVLASRSGPAAPGAASLAADLAGAGVGARIVACDAADRDAMARVLSRIPADVPLTTVIHTAGAIDDGVIGSLTSERVEAVMRPKADAAWNLHLLTQDLNLEAFVLFSSAAATFGAAGQGNYAAANTFLDALAATRRAAGLPGTSVAWGLWAEASGITGHLTAGDLDRMARGGMGALSADEGLSLLDAAIDGAEALVVAARLDVAAIRASAGRGEGVPAIWRGLAKSPPRLRSAADTEGADSLLRQLAATPPEDRDQMLRGLVSSHVAAVLGHASADVIERDRALSEIGFDSLTAVELRNRLNAATGLRLPATLIFDYPTPQALADYLHTSLTGDMATAAVPASAAPSDEPIAIVGMSCRFPGGAHDPEGLWDLLAAGADAISDVPADRGWNMENLYHPDPDHPGTTYARQGGFVRGAAEFDPAFFGISPREALAMDPQQRLLLEISWEALERAGIAPDRLRGSQTGVFAGASSWGYGITTAEEGFLLTGAALSIITGRISYALGLEGPAVTVDTACSSSLVALHLACQALRAGECDLALAGGVAIMATPGGMIGFSRQRGLAADGRSKAFSAAADGMGMAEGAGMLVVERLSDAHRNRHPVLAVVAGSAVNQDGASNGLTAPNGPSQQRVIRAALANAGLTPGQVDAVEAHGTGTELGDPIEAQALIATYGQDRPEARPLLLGSVKSNIGHTQAAAGVAGVMKIVLALQHQVLPQTLHAADKSPHIDWSSGMVRLLTEPAAWPIGDHPRRAGVSSFGFSGTNAHVVLEEAPAAAGSDPGQASTAPAAVSWVLSGRGSEGLRAQAQRLYAYLAGQPGLDPADVGFSLATTRSAFNHRAVVTGADRDELLAGLATVAAGVTAAHVVTGVAAGDHKPVLVFKQTDPRRAGQAARLLDESPVFAARLAECDEVISALTGWSVAGVLRGDPGSPPLDRPDVGGTVAFAVLVSLAALWRSAGVKPAAVVGHGAEEIAAAQVAGVLSLADAAKITVLRGHAPADTELRPALAPARPQAGTIPLYSSVEDAIRDLGDAGFGVFIEAGADGCLREFLDGLAGVYVRGTPVDWGSLAGPSRRRVGLPTYAFQRQRYWPESQASEAPAASAAEQRFWDAVAGEDLGALAQTLGSGEPLSADMPLGEALALLASWRRNRDQPGTRDLRYNVSWRPVDDPPPALAGTWLVVTPDGPGGDRKLTAQVTGALIRYGADVAVLRAARAQRAALAGQIRDAAGTGEPAGVISLLAVGDEELPGIPGVSAGAAATLALVQALGDTGTAAPLWVLTRGAVAVGDADLPPCLAGAQVWGLGRVAALEHPDRWGGLIDLPAQLDVTAGARLAGLLSDGAREDQVAIRADGMLARRLVHATGPAGTRRPWKPRGTALVTGGTGRRGAHVARRLARGGAEHVVLASRQGPLAPGAAALAAEVAGLGARVTVAACDVADRGAVAALLDRAPTAEQPLTVVVHAAGTGHTSALMDTSVEEFSRVIAGKAGGAAHLDELTRDLNLDAFVMFSSGAGVWGSGGQAGYSAANAYLDALAAQRRPRGRKAISVSWGLWEGSGIAEAEGEERLRRWGLRLMAPDLAVAAMREAIEHDETLITVADMDWERFIPVFTAARPSPLLGDLPEATGPVGEPCGGEADWAEQIADLSRDERERLMLDLIRSEVAVVLGYPSADSIDPEGDVLEMGMTSMSAVELRTTLIRQTGLDLPEGFIYDLYTPTAISEFVLGELEAQRQEDMLGE